MKLIGGGGWKWLSAPPNLMYGAAQDIRAFGRRISSSSGEEPRAIHALTGISHLGNSISNPFIAPRLPRPCHQTSELVVAVLAFSTFRRLNFEINCSRTCFLVLEMNPTVIMRTGLAGWVLRFPRMRRCLDLGQRPTAARQRKGVRTCVTQQPHGW